MSNEDERNRAAELLRFFYSYSYEDVSRAMSAFREARNDALEEAAQITEDRAKEFDTDDPMDRSIFAILTVKAEQIRALKRPAEIEL